MSEFDSVFDTEFISMSTICYNFVYILLCKGNVIRFSGTCKNIVDMFACSFV